MKPTSTDYRLAYDLAFISLAGVLNDNDRDNLSRIYYFKNQEKRNTDLILITMIANEEMGHFSVVSTLFYKKEKIFSSKYIEFKYTYNELFNLDASTQLKHLENHVAKKTSFNRIFKSVVIDKLDKAYRHQVLLYKYNLCDTLKSYIDIVKQKEMDRLNGKLEDYIIEIERSYILNNDKR
jgi:hypothetical protein